MLEQTHPMSLKELLHAAQLLTGTLKQASGKQDIRHILQSRIVSFCNALQIECSSLDNLAENELQRNTAEHALWLVEHVQAIIDIDIAQTCECAY